MDVCYPQKLILEMRCGIVQTGKLLGGVRSFQKLLDLRLKLFDYFNSNSKYFNFNKLNYKMQRVMESSSAHAQIVEKFQNVFPNLVIPRVNPNNSIFDALNDIIRKIPKPHFHDTQQTITSMKNYVDGQELRIQMNMIQIQSAVPVPLQTFVKKCSVETRESEESWDDRSIGNVGDWAWDNKGLTYQESLEHEFSSYLD